MGFKILGTKWTRKWLDNLNEMLKDLYEGGGKVGDDSVGNSSLRKDSVYGDKIKDDGINGGTKILNDSIPGTKILTNSVPGRKIEDKTLSGTKLEDGFADNRHFNDDVISGTKLKDRTIPSSKLDFDIQVKPVEFFYGNSEIKNDYLTYDKNSNITLAKDIDYMPTHKPKIFISNKADKMMILRAVFHPMNWDDSPRLFISYSKNDFLFLVYTRISNAISVHHYMYNDQLKTNALNGVKNVLPDIVESFKKPFSISATVQGNYMGIYVNDVLRTVTQRSTLLNGAFEYGGVSFRGNISNNSHINKMEYYKRNEPYIHFSVDDVNKSMKDLTDNQSTYTSIFDNSFFAFLKDMHDKYNTVFSLYLFDTSISSDWRISQSMTVKFKDEFANHSDWLRFGFHAINKDANYNNLTKEELFADYTTIINSVVKFASIRNVDTIPRFHYFGAKRESQLYLKEKSALFDGMLTADDDRVLNAGLNETERTLVNATDDYYDMQNDLYYPKSEKRMDGANTETVINRLNELRYDSNNNSMYIAFWHEGTESTVSGKAAIEAACKWAFDKQIRSSFPMENKPSL